ncbi:hypothetical protein LEP1GSC170_0931 [Leptospira interrogans serovar Bataviae str. HAI135]|uniref:Uncharacterized protein n=1 Tax=Leptospira noguchii serovar Autumnalis str. ZUN142 TaxID=1085540 RepID=M6UDH2_9LEPT|nr:hypothetical protein LEP1GSC170_0931 [Leptospira interrogans serovar Bataviae str. HAI135]EMO39129.1 hypothetical protein LEP1GSC186_2842 [Leptospira noguchii serovar Autumnalis str. ZUN142]
MEQKELNETLFTKAFQVVSHFNYEICERFAPIFLRRTQVKLIFFTQSKDI